MSEVICFMHYPKELYAGGVSDNRRMALNSVKIGIVMLAGWILPLVGVPLGITGLIFGIIGFSSSRADMAKAGVFLNGLGLGLTGLNMVVSFYMLITGKIDPFMFFN
ncbi:MAG: hypothetical protein AB1767_13005 [Bacillota bacterium]